MEAAPPWAHLSGSLGPLMSPSATSSRRRRTSSRAPWILAPRRITAPSRLELASGADDMVAAADRPRLGRCPPDGEQDRHCGAGHPALARLFRGNPVDNPMISPATIAATARPRAPHGGRSTAGAATPPSAAPALLPPTPAAARRLVRLYVPRTRPARRLHLGDAPRPSRPWLLCGATLAPRPLRSALSVSGCAGRRIAH